MVSRSLGLKAITVFSFIVGASSIIVGINGSIPILIIGLFHLATVYGVWTGAFWGWYVGMLAYAVGGVRGLWEIQADLLGGAISIIFAIIIMKWHCLDKDEQVEEIVIDAPLKPAQKEFRHGYA